MSVYMIEEVNEHGPMKEIAERYLNKQIERERKKLELDKRLQDKNTSLENLIDINKKLNIIIKQNGAIINFLDKLTTGPAGDVHYIKLIDYTKTFGEVFIDFVRGERNTNHKLPENSIYSIPYQHVYMVKITNDGPADISFQTTRHAHMIDLKAGESDIISENENFQLTELRLSNGTSENANVRIVLYA